jgi:hypothetical protein
MDPALTDCREINEVGVQPLDHKLMTTFKKEVMLNKWSSSIEYLAAKNVWGKIVASEL